MAYTPNNPNGQATMAGSAPVVIASNQTAVAVTGTFWQATQPVSGTLTVNIGTIAGLATETTLSAMNAKMGALGQAAMAASMPVVIASNQSAIPVTGPLTDTQLRAAAVPVSLASVPSHAVTGPLTDTQLRATPVAVSGTFWQTTQPVSIAATVSVSGPLTDTQLRASAVPVSGPLTDVQMRATAVPVSLASVPTHAVTLTSTTITGTVAVTGTFWQATQPISAAALPLPAGASTEATLSAMSAKMPAAAASADGMANPTTTQIGTESMLFNGSTWDRARNNANLATGDSGAKTATFIGATQTNYNARGALIFVQVSPVSGTTPTMALQLQWSPDGANWINYGPASGNLTTSGHFAAILIYPTNASATPGATPTAFVIPATAQLTINAPLPRLWRIVYSIGGTTPSFTIASSNVNYLL